RLVTIAAKELAQGHALAANGLVGAIFAGDVTQAAVDAPVLINFGNDLVIQIELSPAFDAWHGQTEEVLDPVEPLFQHPRFQPALELLHDAETIMHDGRAHLNRSGAHEHELDRVLPCLDAPYAADRHVNRWIAGQDGYHVQGDGFDRRATIAAV